MNDGSSVAALLAGVVPLLVLVFVSWRLRHRVPGAARVPPQRRTDILPSADADRDAPSADQVFLGVAERVLDAQVGTSDELDSRVATAVSFGGTVLPVTIGLLNLGQQSRPGFEDSIDPLAKLLLGGAIFVYGELIVFAYLSYRQRRIEYGPNILDLNRYTETYSGGELRRWVAEVYSRSIRHNEIPLWRKARYARWVIRALYAEVVVLSLAALWTVW